MTHSSQPSICPEDRASNNSPRATTVQSLVSELFKNDTSFGERNLRTNVARSSVDTQLAVLDLSGKSCFKQEPAGDNRAVAFEDITILRLIDTIVSYLCIIGNTQDTCYPYHLGFRVRTIIGNSI